MRYFLREDNGLSQIDCESNPSYLQYALEHYTEITKEEYDKLCPNEEPIETPTEDYTDLSYLYDNVESPTSDNEPKVEEVVKEEPKVASLPY